MIKSGNSEPDTGENDPKVQELAAEARAAMRQYITPEWMTHSPFLVRGTESREARTPAVEQHGRDIRELTIAALAEFKSKMPVGTAAGVLPAINIDADPPAFKPRPRIVTTRQQASSHLSVPTHRQSQSPATSLSPSSSPDSPAGGASAAKVVPHAVRHSTRAATVAALKIPTHRQSQSPANSLSPNPSPDSPAGGASAANAAPAAVRRSTRAVTVAATAAAANVRPSMFIFTRMLA